MPSNIPSHWSWVKLGDVAISEKGKKPKNLIAEKDKRFSTPYVDIKAFENRGIDNYTDGDNCRFCEPDDVLIVWDGARCGLVGRGIKGAIGSTLAKIKSKKHNDTFLFYFLKQHYKLINSNPKGVGIPHIEPNLFWGLTIPLPPLPEQKKIVEKIEELFSGLDRGVASLKKAKEQIRLYRQSVLASAFSGKLTQSAQRQAHSELIAADPKVEYSTQLPVGWKWVKLGKVITFLGSGVTPRGGRNVYKTEGIKFIRSQNVYPNRLVLEDIAYITNDIDEKMERSRVKPLDVLLNITGASIGRATNIPESFGPANVNQHVCILRTNQNEVRSKYLSLYLNSNFAQQHINRIQIGATRQALNYSQIKMFPFPLCPVYQQTQIVEEIESRFAGSEALEKAIDESLEKTDRLRQSILKQAFEGKLV